MKQLTRDGTVCWASGQHADDLVAMGWVEVKAPPTVPTPMTHAQRRAWWQTRQAVQQAEMQIALAHQDQQAQEASEASDRQWFHDREQKLESLDIALAARDEKWEEDAALEKSVHESTLRSLRWQLSELMELQEKHPHPANVAEIARLRAAIKTLYLQSTRA